MERDQTKITVAAMKLLLGRLYTLTYRQMKIPPDRVEEKHQIMLGNWNRWPLVKSSDPAISDVMSDEVLREIETFLQGVAKDYQAMK